jgi:hypothetical protein
VVLIPARLGSRLQAILEGYGETEVERNLPLLGTRRRSETLTGLDERA